MLPSQTELVTVTLHSRNITGHMSQRCQWAIIWLGMVSRLHSRWLIAGVVSHHLCSALEITRFSYFSFLDIFSLLMWWKIRISDKGWIKRVQSNFRHFHFNLSLLSIVFQVAWNWWSQFRQLHHEDIRHNDINLNQICHFQIQENRLDKAPEICAPS